MTFHAQNFEDVLLARCFEAQATGFYVDVGAEDPDIGSVTRHFYERGWRGLNVFATYTLRDYSPSASNPTAPPPRVAVCRALLGPGRGCG